MRLAELAQLEAVGQLGEAEEVAEERKWTATRAP
jgi:hypothetical protein